MIDIVIILICAVISGADTWVDIHDFGIAKKAWFSRFLELPNGIPSHDTIGRFFSFLDPVKFEVCFTNWIQAVFDKDNNKLDIFLNFHRGSTFTDGTNLEKQYKAYDCSQKTWQHLNFFQHECYLHARIYTSQMEIHDFRTR